MPVLFSPDDQPDRMNTVEAVDLAFLRICQGMLPTHAGNVVSTVEGFRANDLAFDGAALRLCFANARNIGEAYLAAVTVAEAECKARLAARGQSLHRTLVMTPPPARTFGRRRIRDADLPAVASVGGL